MEPLYKNSDIAKAAESAGIIIKLGLPKYIDEKLMIEMMENCRTFVIANLCIHRTCKIYGRIFPV